MLRDLLASDQAYTISPLTAIICLFAAWISFKALQASRNPLNIIPGPLLARFTNINLVKHNAAGTRTVYIHSLHEKYGSVVRIGPNEVSVADPGVVMKIYNSTAFIKDGSFYDVMSIDPKHPSVFNMPDIKEHARRRRIMSPAFSRQNTLRLEEYVREKAFNTITSLLSQTSRKGLCDTLSTFRLFTSDVITYASFGSNLKMVESESVHPFINDIDASMMASSFETTFGGLFYIVRWFCLTFLPSTARVNHYLNAASRALDGHGKGLLKAYTTNFVVDEENKEIGSRLLLAMDDQTSPFRLNIDDVVGELVATMTAGTDTTSATLTYLTYHVFTSKTDILARLRTEVDPLMSSLTKDAIPSYSDIERLPLLSAVIRETLRLDAAAPSTLPRRVPAEGYVVEAPEGSFPLPGNTVVGTQVYSVHRSSVFDRPNEWLPERWIGASKAQDQAFRPFSTGHTACLGQNTAMLELYVMAFLVFRMLDGKAAPGFGDKEMEIRTYFLAAPIAHKCSMQFAARKA